MHIDDVGNGALRVGENERFGSKLAQCDGLLSPKGATRREDRAHGVSKKSCEFDIDISRRDQVDDAIANASRKRKRTPGNCRRNSAITGQQR